ncbi:MAG: M28 family peptidase [Microscillaceae bacterium]|nr:M28 family peptidase [Microscillaceae bacterium]
MTPTRAIAPDTARLYQDVAWLTQLRPYRNYQQVESLDQTAHYLRQAWQAYGYEVHYQSYEARGAIYHNVCTAYNLEAEERLVIGAHYDVDGDQPGADDNASAVAGLLELSRLLQIAKPKLRLGIELVAFTLEESPFFYTDLMGSAVHAQTLREAKVPIRLMICLEMIGYFSEHPGSQKFPHPDLAHYYPDKGNFIALVGRPEEKQVIQQFKTACKRRQICP